MAGVAEGADLGVARNNGAVANECGPLLDELGKRDRKVGLGGAENWGYRVLNLEVAHCEHEHIPPKPYFLY